MLEHKHCGLRGYDASAMTLEEFHAQLAFQLLDLPADDRGLDIQTICGPADRAGFRNCQKVMQASLAEANSLHS
jgi:hypothetical protein